MQVDVDRAAPRDREARTSSRPGLGLFHEDDDRAASMRGDALADEQQAAASAHEARRHGDHGGDDGREPRASFATPEGRAHEESPRPPDRSAATPRWPLQADDADDQHGTAAGRWGEQAPTPRTTTAQMISSMPVRNPAVQATVPGAYPTVPIIARAHHQMRHDHD